MHVHEAPGDVHGPAVVAEVAADLAGHGRDGIREEGDSPRGVEAFDGVHQPDGRDLFQVRHWFAAVAELPCDPSCDSPVAAHELVAKHRTARIIGRQTGEFRELRRVVTAALGGIHTPTR